MKATELMIGNWVYDSYHHAVAKVTTLTRALLWAAVGDDHHQLKYEEVQPIPLAAELLEKNGFRKTSPDGAPHLQSYVLAGDYEDVYAKEINDGTWKVDVDCTEFDLPRQTAMVSYLHQLQNWFRLCGIEKEIIAY